MSAENAATALPPLTDEQCRRVAALLSTVPPPPTHRCDECGAVYRRPHRGKRYCYSAFRARPVQGPGPSPEAVLAESRAALDGLRAVVAGQ